MARMTNVITGEVLDTENATVNQVELFKMKACADFVANSPNFTIGTETTGMKVTVGEATPQFLITAFTNAVGLLYAESTLNNEWEGIIETECDEIDEWSVCADCDGRDCDGCEYSDDDYDEERVDDDNYEEVIKRAVRDELLRLFRESGHI